MRCCLNKAKGFCMCLQLSGMFILLQLAFCLLVSAECNGVGVLVWLIHVVDGQFLSCARCPLLVLKILKSVFAFKGGRVEIKYMKSGQR